MLVQELGYLSTWELELRETDGTPGLRRFDGRGKGRHRVPGVVRVENSIIVVLQVVAMDRNVAEADQAGTAIRQF